MSNQQKQQAANEINRAEMARQVTSNPLYQEAFTVYKAQLLDVFQKTNFKQSEERDEVWRKMQTVNHIEDYLAEAMETGVMAQHTLSMLDKGRKLVGL